MEPGPSVWPRNRLEMNAYLFTGWVNRWHEGRFLDSCLSLILHGAEEEPARKAFEKWLLALGGSEEKVPVKIGRIVQAPFLDQMLTEDGSAPLDWARVTEELPRTLEMAEGDSTAQGYWLDCNQWPPPGRLSGSLESLKSDLPEDIRSGLNWSADKQYFFLVSVLSPVAPPPLYPDEEFEDKESSGQEGRSPEAADDYTDPDLAGESHESFFPELAARELVVLVHARNALVAAWLWRRHAAETALAGNAIRIDAPSEPVRLTADGTQADVAHG